MNQASALDLIEGFSSKDSPWRVDWPVFAQRLRELVANPLVIDQAEQNLCGPATFFAIWFTVDPLAATNFALDLYRNGAARIGDMAVIPSEDSLISRSYEQLARDKKIRIPCAEWVLLGALRDSENELLTFDGDGSDSAAGITTPNEMTKWLQATGCFPSVKDETLLLGRSMEHALSSVTDNAYVVALTSGRMLTEMRDLQSSGSFFKRVQDVFPNHWVWMRRAAFREELELEIWSYGRLFEGALTKKEFERDYYGVVIAMSSGTN